MVEHDHQPRQQQQQQDKDRSPKAQRRRGRTNSSSNDQDNGANPNKHHQINKHKPQIQPPQQQHQNGRRPVEPASSSTHSSTALTSSSNNVTVHPHTSLLINAAFHEENEFWYSTTTTASSSGAASQQQQRPSERDAVLTTTSTSTHNSHALIQKYRSMADQIYKYEVQLYNNNGQQQSSSSSSSINNNMSNDTAWIEKTIQRGTLKDRIAAMSVLLSQHPIHKIYVLDHLLSMIGCSTASTISSTTSRNGKTATSNTGTTTNARVVQMAAQALEDLFIHTLVPHHRKLVSLSHRPLHLYETTTTTTTTAIVATNTNSPNVKHTKKGKPKHETTKATKRTLSPRILLLWRYEEMIKERYDLFLRYYISKTLNDTTTVTNTNTSTTTTNQNKNSNSSTTAGNTNLDGPKIAAIRTASALLRTIPEGETYLLPILVNKLGDPKSTICSATAYELRKVLHLHPNMTSIIAREVQQLVYRPHLSMNAIYNCITFLNQLKLVRTSNNSSSNHSSTTNKKNGKEPNARNNNNEEPSLAVSLMNTYFRLFDVAIQQPPKQDIKTKSKKRDEMDRNNNNKMNQSRLLSALLTGVNRAYPYIPPQPSNSNSSTTATTLLDEHMDALYRVVHTAPPTARTQSLLLLFHIAVGNHSDSTNHRNDTDTRNNEDHNDDRTKTTTKLSRPDRFYRALYATMSEPNMVGTGKHLTMYYNLLYKAMKYETNVTRLVSYTKRLWSTALHCSSAVMAAVLFLLDTIAQEHHSFLYTCYRDVLLGDDALRILDPTKREPRGALIVANVDHQTKIEADDNTMSDSTSEILAPGWELCLTIHHYHPSVQKFAETFGFGLNGTGINYTGDPLRDFALAPFLDKFAYRNPKTTATDRVKQTTDDIDDTTATATEPKYAHSVGARRQQQNEHTNQPLNDPSFIETSQVNADEVFFHKFFIERAKRDTMKGIVRNKPQNDGNANGNDDEEAEAAALDRAEARNADQSKTYEFDDDLWDQWESDDEEEAFVDSLAQQIIEDSMERNMIDDLDDEDPDTDDWDDLHDDNINDKPSNNLDDGDDYDDDENSDEDLPDLNDSDAGDDEYDDDDALIDNDVDDDAFMDDEDSDSAQGERGLEGESEVDCDAVGDADDQFEGIGDEFDDDFSDMVNDDDDDDDGEDAPLLVGVPLSAKIKSDGVFAAAEDYAEIVEKSWKAQKRHYTCDDEKNHNDDDADSTHNEMTQIATNTGKKKKRRKK
jgi:ribosome biogenesis protein MAK21